MNDDMRVTVVGAGLAGCEAAWQLAIRNIPVTIMEMKPTHFSPAHHHPEMAELVCSNSFRSNRLSNAIGLLKEEMRIFDSLIISSADKTSVPAGGALAVDRDGFSRLVTERICSHPLITVLSKEASELPESPAIIATGPLTSEKLSEQIAALPGLSTLNFYDAAAPIVYKESLNVRRIFRAGRYGRGDDYLNCPMTAEEYNAFIEALLSAETAEIHGFEENNVFEGCMPIESMARRGKMVPAFGPMKPVGLMDPRTGKQPFAVVQLRQDNQNDTMYNIVGFQTRLRFHEQKRVFGLIPGLEQAEYARYGVMHRNTFLSSPGFLTDHFEMITRPGFFFAGQMTGVEGYVESAGSGLVAGVTLAHRLCDMPDPDFSSATALGAMGRYVSTKNASFQPMNCTFGLIDPMPGAGKIRDKKQRYEAVSARALEKIRRLKEEDEALMKERMLR